MKKVTSTEDLDVEETIAEARRVLAMLNASANAGAPHPVFSMQLHPVLYVLVNAYDHLTAEIDALRKQVAKLETDRDRYKRYHDMMMEMRAEARSRTDFKP